MDSNKAFQKAVQRYRAGDLREAEKICKEILMVQPAYVDALHLLGVLHYQMKDYDSAVFYIEKVLQLDPGRC